MWKELPTPQYHASAKRIPRGIMQHPSGKRHLSLIKIMQRGPVAGKHKENTDQPNSLSLQRGIADSCIYGFMGVVQQS